MGPLMTQKGAHEAALTDVLPKNEERFSSVFAATMRGMPASMPRTICAGTDDSSGTVCAACISQQGVDVAKRSRWLGVCTSLRSEQRQWHEQQRWAHRSNPVGLCEWKDRSQRWRRFYFTRLMSRMSLISFLLSTALASISAVVRLRVSAL